MITDNIEEINRCIKAYFDENLTTDWIPVKELMPHFIEAGIFTQDKKNGMPIRKVLRELDEKGLLSKIPYVHPERVNDSTYWYFVREGAEYRPKEKINLISKKEQVAINRRNSDEYYVLDLCDELLKEKSIRQHTFDFLLGDFHRDGKSRTALPLDGFYPNKNLVIEYTEKQQSADESSSNQNKMTISGVNRTEQRKIYKQRKKEVLRKKDINFIEIKFKDFEYDKELKIIRDEEKNKAILLRLLDKYL